MNRGRRDLRRGNGAPAKVLTAKLLQRLRLRLGEPPPDGGEQVQRTPTIDVSRLTDEELEVLESALRKSICVSPP
jgi:hypothetical protein